MAFVVWQMWHSYVHMVAQQVVFWCCWHMMHCFWVSCFCSLLHDVVMLLLLMLVAMHLFVLETLLIHLFHCLLLSPMIVSSLIFQKLLLRHPRFAKDFDPPTVQLVHVYFDVLADAIDEVYSELLEHFVLCWCVHMILISWSHFPLHLAFRFEILSIFILIWNCICVYPEHLRPFFWVEIRQIVFYDCDSTEPVYKHYITSSLVVVTFFLSTASFIVDCLQFSISSIIFGRVKWTKSVVEHTIVSANIFSWLLSTKKWEMLKTHLIKCSSQTIRWLFLSSNWHQLSHPTLAHSWKIHSILSCSSMAALQPFFFFYLSTQFQFLLSQPEWTQELCGHHQAIWWKQWGHPWPRCQSTIQWVEVCLHCHAQWSPVFVWGCCFMAHHLSCLKSRMCPIVALQIRWDLKQLFSFLLLLSENSMGRWKRHLSSDLSYLLEHSESFIHFIAVNVHHVCGKLKWRTLQQATDVLVVMTSTFSSCWKELKHVCSWLVCPFLHFFRRWQCSGAICRNALHISTISCSVLPGDNQNLAKGQDDWLFWVFATIPLAADGCWCCSCAWCRSNEVWLLLQTLMIVIVSGGVNWQKCSFVRIKCQPIQRRSMGQLSCESGVTN